MSKRTEAYRKLTQRGADWEERVKMIHEQFPSTVKLEWHEAFAFGDDEEVEILGRVLRDVLKYDLAPEGRSGPRPPLEQKEAEARLRQYKGLDYSDQPFYLAFQNLAQGRSLRHLSSKTGLNRMMIHRLLFGQREPDIQTMELIAKAFKKHPSYFTEYRVLYLIGALGAALLEQPEVNISLYRKLSKIERARI